MIDLYTKIVLTIGAVCLIIIAFFSAAYLPYIGSACGEYALNPCYVSILSK